MELPHKKPIYYSCVKCGYTTNRKSNYMYHINRKIPCVVVVNNLSENNNMDQSMDNNLSNVQNFQDVSNSSLSNVQNFQDVSNSSLSNVQNFQDVQNNLHTVSNLQNVNLNIKPNDTNLDAIDEQKCSKCFKSFSSKYTKQRHEKLCNGAHSLQCHVCKKEFNTRQSKYHHMKYVKCEPVSSSPTINTTNNNTTNNNTTNNTTNNNNNITNNNNTTINNNHQKQIIHQHIQVNAFGNENYDYLLDENQLLKRILQQKDAFMQKIIEAVHFDKEHPENHNIQMTNLQSKHIMIHDGTKFVKALKEPTFDKLIQKKRNMINGNIEE